ncbi:MAG: bifunctional diaminohydroxyphosphoribosylaminopyrimidine deaminase/5-amino-6-(5-phosphoribosylamino)uracil reductase RibD [Rhodobacteraceae bacterium]|nr:bifunctional diaminohydroxyphosphoribosylaminopyrimidine deaminase/5-amino-6-(5-phosphoribosylamino)uracil reductase RibD [Paracoccaceae bacterium]
MALAIALGARGLGSVWPNPAVGCVIVRGGRIVGRGWTQPGGRPHAETVALSQAGALARGATAYVSLEPCSHHGQTPPCAVALIGAGITRVVSAMTDPDARVSGRGHVLLRAAGVEVSEGVLGGVAAAANAGFLARIRDGRPLVTLKLALSLDGRIANAAGASRWITGPEARRRVHALRARHDAVMVGIGTALADDPELTVRDLGAVTQPVRVVLDSRLRLPLHSRLVRGARAVPLWVLHCGDARPAGAALEREGVRLIRTGSDATGRIAIRAALQSLGEAGLTRVFCEGGAQVAAALLGGGHVDTLIGFSAGRVFGAEGTASVGPVSGAAELSDVSEFERVSVTGVGADIMHVWRRRV